VVILGLLGLNLRITEGTATNYFGFFYAGNEISGVIILLCSYIIFRSYHEQWKYKWLLFFLLIATAFMFGTKASIFGVLILCIFIPQITIFKKIKTVRYKLHKLILFTLASLFVLYFGWKYIVSSGIWDRWVWFYRKNELASLLSGRLDYLVRDIDKYLKASFHYKIMGLGGNRTVEMDFFDIIFNFGYFGLFIIYSFYLLVFENARKLRKLSNYPYAKLTFLTLFLLLCISFLAGHVIFSGMASIFIGMFCALTFYYEQESKNISSIQHVSF